MNLPPSVRLVEISPSYPVFEIKHPTCEARVALHGAHVMSWKPLDEDEVLYLSPDAVFKEGKAIRGGIPVCWPWFNAHPTNPEMPSHGIARNRFWELKEAGEDEGGVTLVFEMKDGIWNAKVTVRAGAELEVSLETLNPNEVPIVVSGALHTYFGVSEIEKVRVVNLEGSEYLDTVGEETMRRQNGVVKFTEEVDRIYESSDNLLLVDDVSGRTILVEKGGSPSTVVWNPWAGKAAGLGDMPDADYLKFCCIEAAIANDRAVIVMPGSSHVLSTRISVEE
ncbi:D-hexose-6-phosphate mutarotase [Luteolibacter sp. AS25]|uniref:D-hexose-6-phosphate mutarotase n=1 Tax=Luteolibacter sp. AS25 TaxID=3135776 RepID=UPI00398AF722